MPSGNLEIFGVQQDPAATPVETPAEEVTAAPEDETPETPADRLSRLRSSLHEPAASQEGAVAVAVQRQIDELKGSVDGRLDAIRADLLGRSDEPAPAAVGPAGINFDDPAVGQAFREVYDSEDPAAFGRAVGAVVKEGVEEVRREMTTRLDEVEADSTKAAETLETDKNFAGNMATAIPSIRSMGEQEDAIVDDYLSNGVTSFLGQYLQKYPTLSQDVPGIVGAALAVARMVEIADARLTSTEAGNGKPAEPETAVPEERSVRTEAAPSRGSQRSVQRIKDDAEGKVAADLTPAEALRQSIVDSAGPGRGLPRVFH